MRVLRIAREGFGALFAHRLRTFFMMAGTIVGIAALTVIMAMGKGTERMVMQRVNSFGPRAIMLIAGGGKDVPSPDMTVTTLTLQDAEAVREHIAGLETVSPMAWNFRMNVRRDANQTSSVVWGVEPSWHSAWNWYTVTGEGISGDDVATMARVCLIGQTVKRELFGGEDPIGQRIYINTVSLTVKGVLEKRGVSPMGGDFDNRIILPITTAMRRFMNVDHLGAVRMITKNPSLMSKQAEQLRALMRERHRITPPREEDFRVITSLVIAKVVRGASRTLSALLIALAALSLIVGGIVMMNILLISVSERTKEIGLRRALGATQKDVFAQFLTESLAVTFVGMLVGSVIGLGVSQILSQVGSRPVVVSWEPFALGVGFALLVGTFFGVQPARKAAKLHPVEALR